MTDAGVAAGAVWAALGERRRTPTRGRRLQHLRSLVDLRCTGRGHLLAVVYEVPGDLLDALHGTHRAFPGARLLFVSTDTESLDGENVVIGTDGRPYHYNHLADAKRQRYGAVPGGDENEVNELFTTRGWAPLLDVLDYMPDDNASHPALLTRCRCGSRPPADRDALRALALSAEKDGVTRTTVV